MFRREIAIITFGPQRRKCTLYRHIHPHELPEQETEPKLYETRLINQDVTFVPGLGGKLLGRGRGGET